MKSGRHIKIIGGVFGLLVLFFSVVVQSTAQPSYVFLHLTTKDGLSNGNVTSILKDSYELEINAFNGDGEGSNQVSCLNINISLPWRGKPSDTKWNIAFPDKPVVISEFGGEALLGSNEGPTDEAAYWTEEYQANIYKDQIEMFNTIPNLCGICPWLLFDHRSLG